MNTKNSLNNGGNHKHVVENVVSLGEASRACLDDWVNLPLTHCLRRRSCSLLNGIGLVCGNDQLYACDGFVFDLLDRMRPSCVLHEAVGAESSQECSSKSLNTKAAYKGWTFSWWPGRWCRQRVIWLLSRTGALCTLSGREVKSGMCLRHVRFSALDSTVLVQIS